MDIENRFSLADFPTELLADITKLLPVRDVGELCFTGNHLLLQKFRSGGVAVLASHLDPISFVTQFSRLQEWTCSRSMVGGISYQDLVGLPSAIKSLRWPEKLNLIDFEEILPNLEHLSIKEFSKSWYNPLCCFNASLTSLEVLSFELRMLEYLPSTITDLRIQQSSGPDFDWEKYPLYIEELECYTFPNLKVLHLSGIPPPLIQLPRSVTQLSFKISALKTSRENNSQKEYDWQLLPSELESLTIINPRISWTPEMIQCFPRSIRQLRLSGDSSEEFALECAKELPPLLSKFEVTSLDPKILSFLPSGLTSLTTQISGYYSTLLLPLRLTFLNLGKSLILNPSSLPRTLFTLEEIDMDPIFFKDLPPHLTRLNVSLRPTSPSPTLPSIDSSEVPAIEPSNLHGAGGSFSAEHFSILPATITSLTLRSSHPIQFGSWLPSDLLRLIWYWASDSANPLDFPLPEVWISSLPCRLLHFHVSCPTAGVLTDDHIKYLVGPESIESFFFQGRELTPKRSGITGKAFSQLPPSLRDLCIPCSKEVTVQDFASLPPALRRIVIVLHDAEAKEFEFEPEVVSLLPPRLQVFNVPIIAQDHMEWKKQAQKLRKGLITNIKSQKSVAQLVEEDDGVQQPPL